MSTNVMPTIMKNGEEPDTILLAMIWSAVETLQKRGKARLLVGKKTGSVAIILANTTYSESDGLVPTQDSVIK
jgi:hypothetical protein